MVERYPAVLNCPRPRLRCCSRMTIRNWGCTAAICLAVMTGCGPAGTPAQKDGAHAAKAGSGVASTTQAVPVEKRTLLIFAAASTAPALEKVLDGYRAEHGVSVMVSAGSTGTLGKQIQEGADVDLFLAASAAWGTKLADEKRVAEQVDLFRNQLVIVVPQDSSEQQVAMEELGHPRFKTIAIGDPESVPVGIYAKQALVKAAVWPAVESKLAVGDDVQQVCLFVSRGEADAGIVYESESRVDGLRKAGDVPTKLSEPIRYPLIKLNRTEPHPLADDLYQYLQSERALRIFREAGFLVGPTATTVPGNGSDSGAQSKPAGKN